MNTYSICLERQFVPVDQDIHSNNLVLLNDGTILINTEDDSTILANDLTITNLASLSIDPSEPEFKEAYNTSLMNFDTDTYPNQNRFVKYTDVLEYHKQPMLNTTFKTKFTKILKNKIKQSVVCCLTNNHNILVYSYLDGEKNSMKFLQNLSYQKEIRDSDNIDIEKLSFDVYYDIEFDYTNEYLAVANRTGDVLIFKYSPELKLFGFISAFENICKDRDDDYIEKLRCVKSEFLNELKFVGKSHKNELYLITINTEDFTQSTSINLNISKKEFMIPDFIKLDGNSFYYISADKLYNQNNEVLYTFGNFDTKKIVHLVRRNQIILYSLNEYVLFDLTTQKVVESPITKFLIKKFSTSRLDNPKLSLNIHGIEVANDESFVIIAYSFSVNFGITYNPKSFRELYVTIFKLEDTWRIHNHQYVDSLKLWYFQYKFFGNKFAENYLDLIEDETISTSKDLHKKNFDIPFEKFIQTYILDDAYLGINKFTFLIEKGNIYKSKLYLKILNLFYEYSAHNVEKFDNDLDILSINLIAKKLEKNKIFAESKNIAVTMKGEFIDETFDIEKCYHDEYLVSNEGHQWKQCFLTLLPILSTHTKSCQMVNTFIIDLKKDELMNEYGWFTSTLLSELGLKCLVTGMNYI